MRHRLVLCAVVVAVAMTAGACANTGGAPQHDAFGRPGPTSSTTATRAVRQAGQREIQPYDSTIRAVVADLQRFWHTEFPADYGSAYEPVGAFYAYGPNTNMPVCDGQRLPYLLLQGNAFYCPEDDFIAWDDTGLFPRLDRVYGRFTIALVLAHEWGHAIQQRGGVDEDGVIMEQQADCFAGVWARHLPKTAAGPGLSLDPADLDGAVAGLIGFRDPVGLTPATEGSHGTGFDRVRAFQEGYADGVARCVAYEDDPPELVGTAFPDLRSRLFGGDAPFREVVPNVAASLDAYWRRAGTEAPHVEAVVGSKRSACSVEAVGAEGMPTDDLSYCPSDRTVRWRVDAMRRIYDDIGDFAVATAFAEVWARVYAGEGASDAVSTKVALCRSGAWARDVFEATPKDGRPVTYEPVFSGGQSFRVGLTLSPGDLDEAVQVLLGAEDVRGRGASGDPFARVDSFRVGFFGRIGAC